MKRAVSALSLIVITVAMLPAAGHVNPYKEGTPGVSGYRSEVIAEVMVQADKFTHLAEAMAARDGCALVCRSLPACQRGELQPLRNGRHPATSGPRPAKH